MNDPSKTKDELVGEVAALRRRVAHLESLQAEHARIRETLENRTPALGERVEGLDCLYAYAELDLDGHVLLANERASDILGYRTEEIVGKHFAAFVPPEHVERAKDGFVMARQQQLTGPRKYIVRTKDGVFRTLSVDTILLTKGGRPERVLCLALDVTEQDRAFDQLRDREKHYRLLADNATDMIWTARMEGWETLLLASSEADGVQTAEELLGRWHFTYVSPSVRRLLGYTEEEFKANSLDGALSDQSLRTSVDVLVEELAVERQNAGDISRHRSIELEHVKKDGTRLWCEVTTKFLRNANNRVSGVLGITRSIHERKHAEEILQHSEARLRRLLDNMPDVVVMTDRDGRIQYINRTPAGTPADQLIGSTGLECIQPEYHDACQRIVKLTAETREVMAYEIVDIRDRIWSCRVVPLVVDGSVHSLMVISTDITDRKRAERRLHQSEERFRNLAEVMDDVVWTMPADGSRMLYINPAAERVYGRASQEFYDNPNLWFECVHPEDRAVAAQSGQKLREQGWKESEYRIVRPDGQVRWLFDRGRTIPDQDGNPAYIGGLASDITQRKQVEQVLLEEHGRLRRLLDMHERDRQLVAYEIHDSLAQPLTAALMQMEASLRTLKECFPAVTPEGCDRVLDLLRSSIDEARRLMSGLRPTVLDEFGVISAVSNLIAEACKDQGPEIEYTHKVQFDRLAAPLETAIFRIVQEGVNNALVHSGTDRIRIGLVQQGSQLRIEVQDWGTGFDQQDVQQNRFGLDGIRERARLFDGQASIQSTPGKGTCITVELPLVEAPSAKEHETLAAP